jgi:hypothetical protein
MGHPPREIVCGAQALEGSWFANPESPAGSLTNGLPPREDRVDLVFVGDGGETLQMKHPGTGKVFATVDTKLPCDWSCLTRCASARAFAIEARSRSVSDHKSGGTAENFRRGLRGR